MNAPLSFPDSSLVVVHRDLGPDFAHDTSGAPCPCAPAVFDALDPRGCPSPADVIARMNAEEA